ncbi:MAG: DUF3293 domain-containing protein, partial [Gammaproteobacteria bacterium]
VGDDQYTIDRFSTVGELREYVGGDTDSDENNGNPFSGLEKITQIIASFTPFAVVSAYRSELSDDENQERHEELLADAKSKFGSRVLELEGEFEGSKEKSILVYGTEPVELIARAWCEQYEQDAIIVSDGFEISMIKCDGSPYLDFTFNTLSVDPEDMKMAGGSSSYNGRKFVFTSLDPTNHLHYNPDA